MKEWKNLGVLLLTATAFLVCDIMPAKADTINQDFSNGSEPYYFTMDYCESGCTVNVGYDIIENQTWDDTLGEPVYENYIIIKRVTFQITTHELPPPTDASGETQDLTRWSYNDIDWYYTIPSTIDGMPVKTIDADVYVDCEPTYSIDYRCDIDVHLTIEEGVETLTRLNYPDNSDYRLNIESVSLTLPDSIRTIEAFSCDSADFKLPNHIETIGRLSCPNAAITLPNTVKTIGFLSAKSITFNGTCAQLFAVYPKISTSDGDFICMDGSISATAITYDGTCTEWVEICPKNLQTCTAQCADGNAIADPPVPVDPHYTFDKPTKTATYIGNESETISQLSIPASIEGYTVTSIADEALVGYQDLTTIEVPSTITNIGSHAIGYWRNTDGSYSKMSKVVIYCEEGSTAQMYAIQNGLDYSTEIVPAPSETTTPTSTPATTTPITISVIYGDVDYDGDVDIMDVILLNRNLMIGADIKPKGLVNADVDLNDEVDAVDSLNILKAVVKLITLPVV